MAVFTAGKRRGRWGILHLGESPRQCRINSTWDLAHRRN